MVLLSSDYIKSKINTPDDELLIIEEASTAKSIRSTRLRWVMLIFCCSFNVGSYFFYDLPAALEIYFEKAPYNLSPSQVDLMYSVYSFPNIVLPLFGGVLVDKVGIKTGLLLFTTLSLAG